MIANLTITLDETVLENAEIKAIMQGTSVTEVVREFLNGYAYGETKQLAGQGFLDLARASTTNSEGAIWTRNDAYHRAHPKID